MISLDYTTNNSRWGISGVRFNDLNEYAETLGFLSNIQHHCGGGNELGPLDDSISMHIEQNDVDGAWNQECRIHYYKEIELLNDYLPALYRASSAGRNNITCRINSNEYINHLIFTYNFSVNGSGYTRTVCPSERNYIVDSLRIELQDQVADIESIVEHFNRGWEL